VVACRFSIKGDDETHLRGTASREFSPPFSRQAGCGNASRLKREQSPTVWNFGDL
jgi:hypothetical protein